MKVILIGQAPSQFGDPKRPLIGVASGKRLQELCGMTLLQYARAFDRMNLLDKWPGRSGSGDIFPMSKAREAAKKILPSLNGRRVVLLGRNVAMAFGVGDMDLFKWERRGGPRGSDLFGADVVVVPHPSGTNRWWNDPKNMRRAQKFFRTLAASTGPSRSSKASRGGTAGTRTA